MNNLLIIFTYFLWALFAAAAFFPGELIEAIRSAYVEVRRRREEFIRKHQKREEEAKRKAQIKRQQIAEHGLTFSDWLRLPLTLFELALSFPIGILINLGERFNQWVEEQLPDIDRSMGLTDGEI